MNTNLNLILVGGLLIGVGLIRFIVATISDTPSEKKPDHGDRRVVRVGDDIWVEAYVKHPEWSLFKRFDDIESAKADVEKWNKVRENPIIKTVVP